MFKSFAGLRLHMRKAHLDDYFSEEMAKIGQSVHHRWIELEEFDLAEHEVEFTRNGVRFMNKELLSVFPSRTTEAIKGKRKTAKYKEPVQKLLKEAVGSASGAKPPAPPASGSPSWTVESEPERVLGQSSGSGEHCLSPTNAIQGLDSTLIIELEYYIDEPNTDLSLKPSPDTNELENLDHALLISLSDPEMAKVLSKIPLGSAWV